MANCWNLISCDKLSYPSINNYSGFDLTSYEDQFININNDTTKSYLVKPLIVSIYHTTDSTVGYLSNVNDDFQSGENELTFQITSFIVNGVENISGTPPSFNLNLSNYQPLFCDYTICTPVVTGSTENAFGNLATFFNNLTTNLGLPIKMYPVHWEDSILPNGNDADATNKRLWNLITSEEGINFSFVVRRDGTTQPPIEYTHNLDSNYVATIDFDNTLGTENGYANGNIDYCIEVSNPIIITSAQLTDECKSSCDCLEVVYTIGNAEVTVTLTSAGQFNGYDYFIIEGDPDIYLWLNAGVGMWFASDTLGDSKNPFAVYTSPTCPIGTWEVVRYFDSLEVSQGTCIPPIETCGCPENYNYDSIKDKCIIVEIIEATQNPESLVVEEGDNSAVYGADGGFFYPLLDNLSLPIRRFGTVSTLFQDNGNNYNLDSLILPNPSTNNLWKDRLNFVGIWNNSIPDEEWIGFSTCITVPETSIYTIGISADNRLRFSINGQMIFNTEATDGNSANFRRWHLFPITLQAGDNIIELEAYNEEAQSSFGAEIYKATTQELSLITTITELEPLTIFSTIDKLGSLFDLGETIGYSCPEGYSLDTCGEFINCKRIIEIDPTPCCVELVNCSNDQETILIVEQFEVVVGSVIKLKEYPGICWLVVEKQLPCGNGQIVSLIEAFSNCISCQEDVMDVVGCEITPRFIEPGFTPKYCDPDKYIKINCEFAESVYIKYKELKYGIQTCCEKEYSINILKYSSLKIDELYDPSLCVEPIPENPCPCPVEVEVIICPPDISNEE